MSFFGASSTTNTITSNIPDKEYEINPPPTDGISQVAWSPTMDFLSASSWSNQVCIYEVAMSNYQVISQPKFQYTHDAPVLCTAFTADGTKVMSGGADKCVKLYDMNTQQAIQVGAHDGPIKTCGVMNANVILTGSWDKTLRYWDMRSPNAIATVQLPERVYAMDIANNTCIIACADRHMCAVKFDDPSRLFLNTQSLALKYQTRSVAMMPDGSGYVYGSVEGRVAINYFDNTKATHHNFTFKCHRDGNVSITVHPVNALAFTPEGTFATAGGDGACIFWCKDSRTRLRAVTTAPTSISSCRFNRDASLFAYAASYDWSKGYSERKPTDRDIIYVKPVRPEDIRAKPPKQR